MTRQRRQHERQPRGTMLGFRERDDYSNMYCYAANNRWQSLVSDPKSWLIHVGDRDV